MVTVLSSRRPAVLWWPRRVPRRPGAKAPVASTSAVPSGPGRNLPADAVDGGVEAGVEHRHQQHAGAGGVVQPPEHDPGAQVGGGQDRQDASAPWPGRAWANRSGRCHSANGTVTSRLAFRGPWRSCSRACRNPIQPTSSASWNRASWSSRTGRTLVNSRLPVVGQRRKRRRPEERDGAGQDHDREAEHRQQVPAHADAPAQAAAGQVADPRPAVAGRDHQHGRQGHPEDGPQRPPHRQVERQDVGPGAEPRHRGRPGDRIADAQEGGHRVPGDQVADRRAGTGLNGRGFDEPLSHARYPPRYAARWAADGSRP